MHEHSCGQHQAHTWDNEAQTLYPFSGILLYVYCYGQEVDAQSFQEHSRKVHLALDMWTSRHTSSYLGLVAQWFPNEGDTIVKLTLDFL